MDPGSVTDSADLVAWKEIIAVGQKAIYFEQEARRLWAENEALVRSLDDVLKDLAEAEGSLDKLHREISDMGRRV